MDVANDVVDILTEHDNLRVTTLNEFAFQLLNATVVNVYCINLCTRHHTVAHLRIGKVEGVMEYFHLLFYLVFVLGIIDTRLHQKVEVNLCKFLIVTLLGQFHTNNTQQSS